MTALKVLFLEDSQTDLDITRLQLEHISPGLFTFTSAVDLKAAVAALQGDPFDVVLADLNLPDSKGVDTIRALMEAGCKAPIIAFTGSLDQQHGIDAVNAGATDYVPKGMTDPTTLSNRIAFAAQRGARTIPREALEGLILERTAALKKTHDQLAATHATFAEEKRRQDLFMSAVPDCFTLQDVKTGRFVFISPGYEGIFKRPLRALEANPFDWLSVVHPEDRAGLREHFLNASAAPTTRVAQEFRVVDPDRSLRWVRVTWMPIRSSEGNPAHRAAIIQDVTDEHQLRILREDAATKDKALAVARQTATFKAQFLNMAAHDLATPITPLRLQVAAMRSRALFANDAVALDSIDLLDRNLLRLTGLIQDVLHVARIEVGRIKMKAAPVDLREIVRGATGLLQVQADAGKVTLDVNTDPGPMTGDPDRLGQIVLNLLSNAVKFTPPGGHVKVHLSAKDGKASLAVMDDGRGISQADLAKLFEPFRRVGDLSKAPGTGLGLYISRGLAKRMGGDITAASAGEGKGATFTLTVPLTPPTVPAA